MMSGCLHPSSARPDNSSIDSVFTVREELSFGSLCGFGGLVVSMLASGTQDRGFDPGRSRRILTSLEGK